MAKLERDKLADIEIHVGDPNEQVRDSLRSIMRAEGMRRINTFIRFEDFIESLKKSTPDLLLLADDFDDNIFDVVRDIRNYRLGNNPFTLITMLIAQDNEGGMKKVIQSGADDVLIKPLSPGKLLERVGHLAFNRLPFIATTDYVGPERRRTTDRPSNIPRLDVVNTLKDKVEGRRLSTVQLTRAVNLGMREVLMAQLDSYPLKLAYVCNLIVKSWTEKDVLADRGRQFDWLVSVFEDAARHAKKLRRDALADAWMGMTTQVRAIQATFGEDNKPDIAALQAIPKLFEATKAAFPEEPRGEGGSQQEVA
ncbi:MAG: response regulator [Rhodospirillaceae bacterium]|nr:MAG: response regulator [Rhodospirillaceae bacterium]